MPFDWSDSKRVRLWAPAGKTEKQVKHRLKLLGKVICQFIPSFPGRGWTRFEEAPIWVALIELQMVNNNNNNKKCEGCGGVQFQTF